MLHFTDKKETSGLVPGDQGEFHIMREMVEKALSRIRPTLQKDGGDVVLVDVTDKGVVKVQLTGGCRNCQMSEVTTKSIENFLKSEVPEVTGVERV
jgi:Fe-S cluster biogenesis protein NfuA